MLYVTASGGISIDLAAGAATRPAGVDDTLRAIAKIEYAVPTTAIKTCSRLLEAELGLFPNLGVILAMGDVAIRAINEIGRRKTGGRVIPAGSTYKLCGPEYFLDGIRVLPSYLQTGKNLLIEKSKQQMIAEDLRTALQVIGHQPAD